MLCLVFFCLYAIRFDDYQIVMECLPKLLKLVYLFPLSLYLVSTKLFFPNWSVENRELCIAVCAACIAYFVLAWVLRFRRRKQAKQQALEDLLARARPFRPEMADPHWYEN